MRTIPVLLCVVLFLSVMSGCATAPGRYEGVRTVAVWDLEDLSPGSAAGTDLGQVLSGEIIQAGKDRDDTEVVERQKLVAVMEELRLGSSGLADEETRLKVGRMIGAKEMVFGGYMVVGATMRIDLRRVDVETGRIVRTATKSAASGDLEGWMNAAKAAAEEVFRQ